MEAIRGCRAWRPSWLGEAFPQYNLSRMMAQLRPASGVLVMTVCRSLRVILGALVALLATLRVGGANDVNDYPTSARSEYVFGCLKANGETRQSIEQCSCSIDVIASVLPYDRYVTAETVLSMAQVRGNLGGQFRTSEQATSAVNDLRRAQAEAEVRCF